MWEASTYNAPSGERSGSPPRHNHAAAAAAAATTNNQFASDVTSF
jgi:hypothetical protein